MNYMTTTLESLLKAHGHSYTKPRALVFELLRAHEPMTMRELAILAGARLDRASLYRIVGLFETLGIVRRVNIGWKYKLELSDVFNEHHHHLSCTNCQKVITINEAKLEQFISQIAQDYHFAPSEHQVEIQGLCADCQTGQTTPPEAPDYQVHDGAEAHNHS